MQSIVGGRYLHDAGVVERRRLQSARPGGASGQPLQAQHLIGFQVAGVGGDRDRLAGGELDVVGEGHRPAGREGVGGRSGEVRRLIGGRTEHQVGGDAGDLDVLQQHAVCGRQGDKRIRTLLRHGLRGGITVDIKRVLSAGPEISDHQLMIARAVYEGVGAATASHRGTATARHQGVRAGPADEDIVPAAAQQEGARRTGG